jgi:site-specific DNA recombinase
MTTLSALFVRVSSKEQEEGYSLASQQGEGEEYALRRGFVIDRKWAVAESAKDTARKAFKELVQYVKARPQVKVLLFEKPDRMTRNFADLVTIYELVDKYDKEIHFYKTGLKINRQSRSSDQVHLDMEVVWARKFITNLREEVKKGMLQKVRDGGAPHLAPVGYRNNRETAGVELDPVQGPLVKRLWHLAATGRFTVDRLTEKAAELGIVSRRTGKPLCRSGIHGIFEKTFYYGLVKWGGEEVTGNHETLISKALFDQVQEVLRNEGRRPKNLSFPFKGLPVCGSCGSGVTAEQHTKHQKNGNTHRYVYYRCTGWRNGRNVCKDSYIREEELADQLGEPLKQLVINAPTLGKIRDAIRRSTADERQLAHSRLAALKAEETRLKKRLEQAYEDKLDGVLPAEEYRERSEGWRNRLVAIGGEIAGLEKDSPVFLEEASKILDLARRAHGLYARQRDNYERRKLIDLMGSKVVISGRRAVLNLREPFNSLSKLAFAANSGKGDPEWYARQDLNL